MRHPGPDPWYAKDRCGPLFVFYHRDASVCPSIGDDDGRVAWCICPDDEDKAEERPIAQGCAATPEDAMREVATAASEIARDMLAWASGAPDPARTAAASRTAAEPRLDLLRHHVGRSPLGWYEGRLTRHRSTTDADVIAWLQELNRLVFGAPDESTPLEGKSCQ